jgi:hypothetical protein
LNTHSSGQPISIFPHIEGITVGTEEEMYEVAGRAGRISKVGDQTSEGQDAGDGSCFAARSLAGIA